MNTVTGAHPIKTCLGKFTHSFCKLGHFVAVNNFYNGLKWDSLNTLSKFSFEKFYNFFSFYVGNLMKQVALNKSSLLLRNILQNTQTLQLFTKIIKHKLSTKVINMPHWRAW